MKFLEAIGGGVIHRLAYAGGLTIQFRSGLCASPHVRPAVGKRGRWLAAMRQMAAIGVDALPVVAIMSMCARGGPAHHGWVKPGNSCPRNYQAA